MDGWSEDDGEGEGEEGCVRVRARRKKDMKEGVWRENCRSLHYKASEKEEHWKQTMSCAHFCCPCLSLLQSYIERVSLSFFWGWGGGELRTVSCCSCRLWSV